MDSTATPDRDENPPPPEPDLKSDDAENAGAGARLGVAVLALALLFLAAVAVVAMADISSLTPCDDVTEISQLNDEGECFDGSSAKKVITLIFGWPGAILACLSVLLAAAFVVRGRGARPLGLSIAGAVILFGLSILIGAL